MSEAAPLMEGEHDFTSFAAVDPERSNQNEDNQPKKQNNIRTIFSSQWREQAGEFIYEVRGNGFLHHMVRNLVGTFLLVGKGTLESSNMATILQSKNRSAAGATAPANGLYLVNVEY